ncbi:interleukin-1 receptor accessory protein [Brachionichthys hirsutus]|uniref:interleukin-1 receptor accessory protein n=1 Tax=Brachionichthys hirsutus TaxID=412623 RepID=UPI003604FCBE
MYIPVVVWGIEPVSGYTLTAELRHAIRSEPSRAVAGSLPGTGPVFPERVGVTGDSRFSPEPGCEPRARNRSSVMASFIATLLILSIVVVTATADISRSVGDLPGTRCHGWEEFRKGAVSVLEGEVGWLSCPLLSHPPTQLVGHNLAWYHTPEGSDLEQPIRLSSRLTEDGETLWLQPAAGADAGRYVCVLGNTSSCIKTAIWLKVLRQDQLVLVTDCPPPAAVAASQEVAPLQEGKLLECPDLEDAAKMADSRPTVTWVFVKPERSQCERYPFWERDREQVGTTLRVNLMKDRYQGLYYCTVRYQRGGTALSFTRTINVTAVYPSTVSKKPSLINPSSEQSFSVRRGSEVRLLCKGVFPFLDSAWDIWWTVDGKTLDELPDPRFSNINSWLKDSYGTRTEESVLVIEDFRAKDLDREYNCSVKNERGFQTRRARLQEEAPLPLLELGCGLGVTLLLLLLLFVTYHVFWLELLLLYRSCFGTDERQTDDKTYDVYISYVRNGEEEEFVLSTLRGVLENELGYSVCIFDRDSLPGGTITDETLGFVARSRRLLVVIGPGYARRGSQTLLELKAGIDTMALGGHLRVILVQYKPVRRQGWVKELRRAQVALTVVRWQGDKSTELTSHFWKRLRVELPVRRVGGGKDMSLLRLQSQTSTTSQTGLISNTRRF